MEELIKNWLKLKYPHGYELYADRNDCLQDNTIREILEDKDPRTAFNEKMYYAYGLYDGIEYKEIAENAMEEIPALAGEDLDDVEDCIRDNLDVIYPTEHFLQQRVRVDIYVDTGDSDYDFVSNAMYPHYNGRVEWINDPDDIPEETEKASLLWLAETQGYSKEDFLQFLCANTDNSTYKKNGFLNSVFQELVNMSTHMPALVFLKTFTLGQLIDIVQNKKDIYIPTMTMCGLYDSWSGGGGPLEIELEKPVTLPYDKIFRIYPARSYSYNIDRCYGLVDEAWDLTNRKRRLAA
jgi:hypothetical protein